MNVIFICGGYYPDTSATGNCVRQIADKFTQHGDKVYIVCKSGTTKQYEEELNGQQIYRITNKRLSNWYRITEKQKTLITRIELLFYKSFWAIHGLTSPDGLDRSLVNKYVNKTHKIMKSDTIDAIIPCCMPAECLGATHICINGNNIKVFPLLYDLYSENTQFFRYKWSHALRRGRALELEKDLFSSSKKIFYVDNWKQYFLKYNYPNAVRVEHPLLVYRKPTPGTLKNKNDINVIYQGEINHQMRPPTAMLKAFEYIVKVYGRISLHICAYGNSVDEVEQLANKNPEHILFYGCVGKDVADQLYDAADVAVVIANKNPDIVPSKIFECIASGFPIVYFYYSKEEKTYALLKKYHLVYFVSQDDNSVECYKKLADWIYQHYLMRLGFADVLKDYADATPDYVFDEISRLIKEDEK